MTRQAHMGEGIWHEYVSPDGTYDALRRAGGIVRCRDCEQGHKAYHQGRVIIDCHGPLVQTWDYYNDEPLVNEVEPDGFCAWGVRRADA